jgi:hypothetical protein
VGGLIILILSVCRRDVKESTRIFTSLARRVFRREGKLNQFITNKVRRDLKYWFLDGLYSI